MKGFLEEYGLIIVVVAVILLMLLFGKSGFAKNIQDAILGSANHIVETGESVTDKETGDILKVGGKKYIVMSKKAKDTYLVISGESIGNIQFQPNQDSSGNYYDIGKYNENDIQDKRYDGQNSNVYEDSYIDKYLEMTYYDSLPEKLKKAIVPTQIKQTSYTNTGRNNKWRYLTTDTNPASPDGTSNWFYNEGTTENPKWVRHDKANIPDDAQGAYPFNCWKQNEKGYNNTTYNTISRHVFLPSVEEVSNLVDLNNANKVYNFLKGTNNSLHHMWFRDSASSSPRTAIYLNCSCRSMDNSSVTNTWLGVRPAFTVDLSKVDYTEVGHVNYK